MIYDSGPVRETVSGWVGVAHRLNLALMSPAVLRGVCDLWVVDINISTPGVRRRQHMLSVAIDGSGTGEFSWWRMCHHLPAYEPATWPRQQPEVHASTAVRIQVDAGLDETYPVLAARELIEQIVDGRLATLDEPYGETLFLKMWRQHVADAIRSARTSPEAIAARAHLN